jgi:hypothetical protein
MIALNPVSKHLVMACHITGIYDVNRNTVLPDDDYEIVRAWAESLTNLKLQGIIFHNNFSPETCEKYQNDYISFIKTDYNPQFNPNVFRYFVYRDFLSAHEPIIESLFITDISDVVTLKNPFVQPLFTENPSSIFCGDEPKRLNNDWMKDHATHLRNKIADYSAYENAFGNQTLLNCGIIGGHKSVMLDFLEKLCTIHERYNADNKTAFTGDMGAFNYLARTAFNDRLLHGAPVNTVFKAFQNADKNCWFQHK